jgi:hypothetical protein
MKKLLQEMLYLDERTGKFSTSKFMTLVSFYFIIGLTARSIYMDKEVKELISLEQVFMICSTLYFGRRFNFKTKNMEMGGDSGEAAN